MFSLPLSGFPQLLVVDFTLQITMFSISYSLHTDRLYDLTGTSTFVILTFLSYSSSSSSSSSFFLSSSSSSSSSTSSSFSSFLSAFLSSPSPRKLLVTCMISLWALRLGSFLVYRIFWYGRDPRFDKVLPNPRKFFFYWMIQGVWAFVTSAPAHVVNFDQGKQPELGWIDLIGFLLWTLGFLYETIADYHKFYFRLTHPGKSVFVQTGLWSLSRHPNYLGEIVLWWGVFLVCLPALQGFQYLTVLCPVFVTYLLTRVSGVPLMEKQYKAKYGSDPQYLKYVAETPVLIPKLF